VHANAAADVPARLEALGSTAGLDRAALHSQLAAALAVVIHLVRDGSGLRRVSEIHVLQRGPDGLVVTRPALLRDSRGDHERGPGWQRLAELCSAGAS
jgi:pilus assembly protein CpaF